MMLSRCCRIPRAMATFTAALAAGNQIPAACGFRMTTARPGPRATPAFLPTAPSAAFIWQFRRMLLHEFTRWFSRPLAALVYSDQIIAAITGARSQPDWAAILVMA